MCRTCPLNFTGLVSLDPTQEPISQRRKQVQRRPSPPPWTMEQVRRGTKMRTRAARLQGSHPSPLPMQTPLPKPSPCFPSPAMFSSGLWVAGEHCGSCEEETESGHLLGPTTFLSCTSCTSQRKTLEPGEVRG